MAVNLGVDAEVRPGRTRRRRDAQRHRQSPSASPCSPRAKAEAASAAGAEVVGLDDLASRSRRGDMPFDVVIATPTRCGGRQRWPDPRSARPDAEPEGRHRDHGRRHGGEERQGRSGAVPQPTRPASSSAPSAALVRGPTLQQNLTGPDRRLEQGQTGRGKGHLPARKWRCPTTMGVGVRAVDRSSPSTQDLGSSGSVAAWTAVGAGETVVKDRRRCGMNHRWRRLPRLAGMACRPEGQRECNPLAKGS